MQKRRMMSQNQNENKESHHISVMAQECLQHFAGRSISVFFDGTLGAGGHARLILEAHPEITKYIACDRDPDAIEIARRSLAPWKEKVEFVHGNFADLDEYLKE